MCSKKVISWKLSNSNDAELINTSLNDAFSVRKKYSKSLIFHSDQGSNYCSSKVRENLKLRNVVQSMSRKGNCWDNAGAESFFSTIKREMKFSVFKDLAEAKQHIFEYIEIFYNRKRSHSSINYASPMEFESSILT